MKINNTLNYTREILTALFLLFSATACIGDDDPADAWSLPLGSEMPQFTVTLLDGTTVKSSDLAGSTAVIVLFNTSCSDCRTELPVVNEVYKTINAGLADKNSGEALGSVRFLCIARAEGAESVSQFWADNSLTLPVSPQPDRGIYSLFAESVIPRIMIFSPSGHLTASFADSPLPTAQTILTAIRNTN